MQEPLSRDIQTSGAGVSADATEAESAEQNIQTDIPPLLIQDTTPAAVSDLKTLIAKLSSDSPLERVNAAMELGKLGPTANPAIPHLIAILSDSASVTLHTGSIPALPTSPAREAMTALIQIGDPSVEPLIGALKERNSEVQQNAAEALGDMNDVRAVEPLIALLNKNDTTVRKNALEALGKLGDVRAVDPILEALKDRRTIIQDTAFNALKNLLGALTKRRDIQTIGVILGYPDSLVRRLAITALGDIPSSQSAALLVPVLDDPDTRIRDTAIDVLKKIGEPAGEPLVTTLQEGDIKVRILAAMILGDIRDTRAVEPLMNTLSFHSGDFPLDAPRLRFESASALKKIRDPRAVEPLIRALKDDIPAVRESARTALEEIGTEAVEQLNRALLDPDPGIRVNIAKILGEFKDPRAVEPLIQALLVDAAEDKSWLFRVEAAKALGQIKDPRAIEPLNILLSDRVSHVRNMAQWAIEQISGTSIKKNKGSWWQNLFD